jgi:hypothetical protein
MLAAFSSATTHPSPLLDPFHPQGVCAIISTPMPKTTTAYAKNIIRRSFRELVDPTPDKKACETLWSHFRSRCAYCGIELRRDHKEAHVDHLISASEGGPNHLSNRVLSCAQCNEVEKRDLEWTAFLRNKCQDAVLFEERRQHILRWCESQRLNHAQDENLLARAAELADEVIALYDRQIAQLRTERR